MMFTVYECCAMFAPISKFYVTARYAVVTCEIKLFQNYFSLWAQLVNIFQYAQCR